MIVITLTANADTQALGANTDLFPFKKLWNSFQYDDDGIWVLGHNRVKGMEICF